MTRLFRSKSCGLAATELNPAPPPPPAVYIQKVKDDEEEELECDDGIRGNQTRHSQQHQQQFAILDVVVGVLKRSLVTCSVVEEEMEEEEEDSSSASLDISWPTDVRHVSHVTFDRFNGFLGLPSEFQPEVPTRVPSARSISSSIFFLLIFAVCITLMWFMGYFSFVKILFRSESL